MHKIVLNGIKINLSINESDFEANKDYINEIIDVMILEDLKYGEFSFFAEQSTGVKKHLKVIWNTENYLSENDMFKNVDEVIEYLTSLANKTEFKTSSKISRTLDLAYRLKESLNELNISTITPITEANNEVIVLKDFAKVENCDECCKPIEIEEYRNNKGLCNSCVEKIN